MHEWMGWCNWRCILDIFSAMEKPCWDKTGKAKAELGAYLMGSAEQRSSSEL